MSTSPSNPVFGDPSQAGDNLPRSPAPVHQITNGNFAAHPPAEVDPPSAEINSIAAAIEELQNRLEKANSQWAHASAVQTTEVEIGRLFVEAQRFSEASISKLEQQIQEILQEAETKATQILREATEEAHEIRRQAQDSAYLSTQASQDLRSAIAGFTVVNSALVTELTALNTMLTPSAEQRISSIDHSSSAIGSM